MFTAIDIESVLIGLLLGTLCTLHLRIVFLAIFFLSLPVTDSGLSHEQQEGR